MIDRLAYLPLETYPEAASDAAVLSALGIAAALGCKVHASTFAVTIPPVASPIGGGLINIEGMVRAAEERSLETCNRLHALIKATGPDAVVERQNIGMGGTMETATAESRYFDLSVLPWVRESGVSRDLAQALIFGSGRPAILVPEGVTSSRIDHIAVAWDGSRAATRAMNDALSFLPESGRVSVLTVHGEKALQGQDIAATMADALSRRGIDAKAIDVPLREATIAAALQTAAAAEGAQLMVMGGFGHSRLRDFILGGATKDILANVRLPVLLSH